MMYQRNYDGPIIPPQGSRCDSPGNETQSDGNGGSSGQEDRFSIQCGRSIIRGTGHIHSQKGPQSAV